MLVDIGHDVFEAIKLFDVPEISSRLISSIERTLFVMRERLVLLKIPRCDIEGVGIPSDDDVVFREKVGFIVFWWRTILDLPRKGGGNRANSRLIPIPLLSVATECL